MGTAVCQQPYTETEIKGLIPHGQQQQSWHTTLGVLPPGPVVKPLRSFRGIPRLCSRRCAFPAPGGNARSGLRRLSATLSLRTVIDLGSGGGVT